LKREIARYTDTGKEPPAHLDEDRRAAWRAFFEIKRNFHDVRPPYCQTVHKSQGSTYKFSFVDVGDVGRNTKWYETARLLYVALTRASHTAFTIGELPERLYSREAA